MSVLRARILVTLKPSDVAWLVLGAGVICYELSARDGELLSEAAYRYQRRHPWITRAVIVATAGHLMRLYPRWCDPWTWAWLADKRIRQHRTLTGAH